MSWFGQKSLDSAQTPEEVVEALYRANRRLSQSPDRRMQKAATALAKAAERIERESGIREIPEWMR